jgi:hypothetical protein
MTRRALLSVLFSLSVSSEAVTQSASAPKFRVALKISGDSAIASETEGYLKQDLGLLNDVEITETKPDYTINVIVMEIESKGQIPMGVALTCLTLYHPKGFFEDCSLIEDYRLMTLEREELRSDCQRLVERFDSKSLGPHRKLLQKSKP